MYSIGKLAQLSGLNTTLIRVWERRHAFLKPERLANGHRRYTQEDLRVLQNVQALIERGLNIGDIARLGREELLTSVATAAVSAPGPRMLPSPSFSESEDDYLDGRHPEIAWSILDALPCAVIVTDKHGLIRWVNRGVPVLCGYDLAELHGLRPGSVLQGPGSDQEAAAKLRQAVTTKRPCTVAILNYHKSGEPYLALVDVTPLGFGANHVGFVGTARRIDAGRKPSTNDHS